MKKNSLVLSTAALAALSIVSNPIMASGFAIKEVSAKLLGSAFSNASTSATDISSIHYNPATLGLHDQGSAYTSVSYLDLDTDISNVSANFNPTASSSASNPFDGAFVPAVFAGQRLNKAWSVGIAITAPFGLASKYDADWAGRAHAIESSLTTVNVNPIVSYNVNEQWIVAAGLQIIYADAKLTNTIATSTLVGEVTGDGYGYGASLGAVYMPSEDWRFGLGIQSQISTELEGETEISNGTRSDGTAPLSLPEKINFGFHKQVNEQWAITGDIQWTHWERFDELKVKNKNPAVADIIVDEEWSNVFYYALGAHYKMNSAWDFSFGLGYDESPVPDRTRTPRIPDSDRTWFSVGGSYHVNPSMRLDLGYTHVTSDEAKINLDGTGNDATRGTLAAKYDSSVNILAAGFSWQF